ncbi:MAG: M23 family metallopeptidase [Bacteroidetes bacterium]|nr:M23 family metallopeptidase [Bacteroidota bacterium]
MSNRCFPLVFFALVLSPIILFAQDKEFEDYKNQQNQELNAYQEQFKKEFEEYLKQESEWNEITTGTKEKKVVVPSDQKAETGDEKVTGVEEKTLPSVQQPEAQNPKTPETKEMPVPVKPELKQDKKEVGKLSRPVDKYKITSKFGYRIHPIFKRKIFHAGDDFGTPAGTDLIVKLAGVVERSGEVRGYGNFVLINHGNGIKTAYAHLSASLVSEGQELVVGQVFAKTGNTGNSTGPHLHFEVIVNGVKVSPERFWN